MPGGRPEVIITPEQWDKIFFRISTEQKSTQKICKEEGICFFTIWKKLNHDEELIQRYARAKEEQSELLVDEILEIADDAADDWEEVEKKNGDTYLRLNREHFERSRLKIDTRKWIASKLKPKKYGEKLQQELSGADGKALEVVFGVPAKKLPGENEAAGSSIQSSKSVSD